MGETWKEKRQLAVGQAIKDYFARGGVELPLTSCTLAGDAALAAYVANTRDPAPYPLNTPGATPKI